MRDRETAWLILNVVIVVHFPLPVSATISLDNGSNKKTDMWFLERWKIAICEGEIFERIESCYWSHSFIQSHFVGPMCFLDSSLSILPCL